MRDDVQWPATLARLTRRAGPLACAGTLWSAIVRSIAPAGFSFEEAVIASFLDTWTAANPVAVAVLSFVSAQRLAELALASRNTRRLLAKGGVELGRQHYLAMVGLHACWL